MQTHFATVSFFCVTADVYSHSVEILVWPLCLSFS